MKGHIRLVGALLVGLAIIAGGFLLRGRGSEEPKGVLSVAETEDREYIEVADSDGDGVSDWEEALGARVLASASSTRLTLSPDAEYTEPDTYTEKFAQKFFEDFILNKTGNALPKTEEEFLQASISNIEKSSEGILHTRREIQVIEDTEFATREYGNRISEIVNAHTVPNENEAVILARALDTNDPGVLTALEPIRHAYEELVEDTLLVPAPASLVEEHLDLVNTYEAILTDITAMEQAFKDPIYTLARMKRYEEDATALLYAFENILTEITRAGVIYANDEPGSFLYLFET